ncbi:SDR family oxidoreductase [Glaciecola sp. XM2]|jgi:short-subunit dehydrogenase|uniref:SDR family oxidoreductase n=1 Tax=Glaciecola sp. XM2 TaxID=1914931 RepID=UPI001BDE414B|nr:SDR family oxidoreductase [Glaciecola sp. XM2]MBT1449298.1 SDR family oxidoreductase [Glaciecola sp. XM2]
MSINKLCVVTGASGGIGSEIAIALDLAGHRVIIQGRNEQKLLQLQKKMRDSTEIVVGDLTDTEQRSAAIKQIFKIGSPDLLVNAAGVSDFKSFDIQTHEEIEAMIATNLLAPILLIHGFLNEAKQRSFNNSTKPIDIINIGSAFGYIGYPGFSSYCATKSGLRGFTESLAREYSDSSFTFKYFAPRATKTDINSTRVDQLNVQLGNAIDLPTVVAQEFMSFYQCNQRERVVGWPEKLFVRINALFPSIIDKAIKSKLATINQYLKA